MARVQSIKATRSFDRWLIVVEFVLAIAIIGAIFGEYYGLFSTLLFVMCSLGFAFTGMVMWRMVTSLSNERLEIRNEPIDEVRESLLREKKLLTEGLKELAADYGAGKVDEEDYEALRLSAENRALEVIKRLKNEDAKWLLAAREAAGLEEIAPPPKSATKKADAMPPSQSAPSSSDFPPADARLFSTAIISFVDSTCSGCGAANPKDARFCISCGCASTKTQVAQ